MSIEKQVAAAMARVPTMALQELQTLRQNALKYGESASALIGLIDERLLEFEASGGMAAHRLEFARNMLRIVRRSGVQWQAGRDVFNQARLEFSDSPFVIWMAGNGARQIPVTKALDDVMPEFPDIERRKDGVGQSDRVYFRRRA